MKSLGIPRNEHAGGGILDPIYVETERTYDEEYDGQGDPIARSRSRSRGAGTAPHERARSSGGVYDDSESSASEAMAPPARGRLRARSPLDESRGRRTAPDPRDQGRRCRGPEVPPAHVRPSAHHESKAE
eukprot:847166-Pyramimonas_sp.AAC.1